MNKPTITIGIPAYNEERNIRQLLDSILSQKISSGELTKIIVISDASTDNTAGIAESFTDARIIILQKEKREGAYKIQNYLVKNSDSDILILLNADILPANDSFVEELIKPILCDPKVGIVCGELHPAKPRNFFEKIIVNSHKMKNDMYSRINNGNNLYYCVGVARALSKEFYKKLEWPEGIPEDAYSYFACIRSGFKFVYKPSATLIFRTPSNFRDHIKQSTRFFGGQSKMSDLFGKELADKEYNIPASIMIGSIVTSVIKAPLLTFSYLALMTYIKVLLPKNYKARWDMAISTKEAITREDRNK